MERSKSVFILMALLFCVAAFATRSYAENAKPVIIEFDLPAGDASSSLREFAKQAHEQIIFSEEAVQGIKTNTVQGKFPAEEALSKLIFKKGLVAVRDQQTKLFTISRPSQSDAAKKN